MIKKLNRGTILKNTKDFAYGMPLLNANGDVDTSTTGYQYTIQTTTAIRAKVVKQKFYQIPVADFIPVIVGTGSWSEDIKTNLVYDAASPFESGNISTSSAPSQISHVDVATAPITTKITTWAKGYQYSIPEVQKALAANNWDVVSAKLEALKRNWDLGIQKTAFLGLLGDLTNTPGLLTNPNVNSNTSVITANISSLSSSAFQTLVANIMTAFVQNSAYTSMPNTFIMPMDDYLGMAAATASGFPIVTMLDYLLNAFKMITGNQNFQIKPLAYSNLSKNAAYVSVSGKYRYVLYNNDPEVLAMDIPVDFTLTPAGTSNNFHFQGVAAGQYAGVTIYRPAEVLYFDHS